MRAHLDSSVTTASPLFLPITSTKVSARLESCEVVSALPSRDEVRNGTHLHELDGDLAVVARLEEGLLRLELRGEEDEGGGVSAQGSREIGGAWDAH